MILFFIKRLDVAVRCYELFNICKSIRDDVQYKKWNYIFIDFLGDILVWVKSFLSKIMSFGGKMIEENHWQVHCIY